MVDGAHDRDGAAVPAGVPHEELSSTVRARSLAVQGVRDRLRDGVAVVPAAQADEQRLGAPEDEHGRVVEHAVGCGWRLPSGGRSGARRPSRCSRPARRTRRRRASRLPAPPPSRAGRPTSRARRAPRPRRGRARSASASAAGMPSITAGVRFGAGLGLAAGFGLVFALAATSFVCAGLALAAVAGCLTGCSGLIVFTGVAPGSSAAAEQHEAAAEGEQGHEAGRSENPHPLSHVPLSALRGGCLEGKCKEKGRGLPRPFANR